MDPISMKVVPKVYCATDQTLAGGIDDETKIQNLLRIIKESNSLFTRRKAIWDLEQIGVKAVPALIKVLVKARGCTAVFNDEVIITDAVDALKKIAEDNFTAVQLALDEASSDKVRALTIPEDVKLDIGKVRAANPKLALEMFLEALVNYKY